MTAEKIDWSPSEWADEGDAAEFAGYVADVWREEFGHRFTFSPEMPDEQPPLPWAWRVMATSEVSEYPELQDSGDARTRDSAKRKAEAALRRASRRNQRQTAQTGGQR